MAAARVRSVLSFALLGAALGAWHAPNPGTGPGPAKGTATGRPVPRFESFRSDQIYMRAGPGFQYPITWVYHRNDLPVEVTAEFNVWRRVLAPDGGVGWVHEALLHLARSFIVTGGRHTMRAAPHRSAAPVAYLDKGVIGALVSCRSQAEWCAVEAGHRKGWLPRRDLWGVFPHESVK